MNTSVADSPVPLVMIVEDDPSCLESLQVLVEADGICAVCASNGKVALDLLHTGMKPALIVLDLHMPIMDGFSFRREQLSDPAFADIPVVLLSADYNAHTYAQDLGVDAWLSKPADPSVLLDTIKQRCRAL